MNICRLFFVYLLLFFLLPRNILGQGRKRSSGTTGRCYFLLRLRFLTAKLGVIWGVWFSAKQSQLRAVLCFYYYFSSLFTSWILHVKIFHSSSGLQLSVSDSPFSQFSLSSRVSWKYRKGFQKSQVWVVWIVTYTVWVCLSSRCNQQKHGWCWFRSWHIL